MKKSFKKSAAIALAFGLMCSNVALAGTSNSGNSLKISNAYVKGSSYNRIATGKKTGTTKKLSVNAKGNTRNLDTIINATISSFNK